MAGELNWAGNYEYRSGVIEHPGSVEELQGLVAAASKVRALGTRHSFNAIADADAGGTQIALSAIPPRIDINEQARTVTVGGGLRYGDVAIALNASGWALHNLASLPHISVAGAVATGTHGSGDRNRNLSSAVAGLEIVRADGELVTLRRRDPDFAGAVVGLGALGIVTAVTLDIEPTYDVEQRVFHGLPWERALADLDAVTGSAYSVSLFTNWRGDAIDQVWLKSRSDAAGQASGEARLRALDDMDDLFGARPATEPVHMLPTMSPVNCTQQLGVPGPWHERLAHFRLEFTPSNGAEIQSEYLVPRANAVAAIEALRGIGDVIAPVLQITEIRTMAADDLWLSEAFGRDTVGLHFTWLREQDAVEQALVHIKAALEPFEARPHWGKVFLDADGRAASLYPRIADFRDLAERYDPRGVFRNEFLERHVFA